MTIADRIAGIILEVMLGTAWGRQPYVDKLRSILLGAFGEYMCREISLKIGERDHWSNEVIRILKQITDYMDFYKTTFKNREKALAEAMDDALGACYGEITFAKNKVFEYYRPKYKKIKQLEFDEKQEFRNMIKEFLPQYFHLMKEY